MGRVSFSLHTRIIRGKGPSFQILTVAGASSLTSVERLGKLHEVIASAVKRDKDDRTPQVKVEEVRFARAKSGWKIPM
jgi:hypothetical protein